jgi:hypothetical protein
VRWRLAVAGAWAVTAVRRLRLTASRFSAPLPHATTPAGAKELAVGTIGCGAAARPPHHRLAAAPPAIALPPHNPAPAGRRDNR